VGLHNPTREVDFAAVLDETRDAVRITCELEGSTGGQWSFLAEGVLSANMGGTLAPTDASHEGRGLAVEILLFRKRLDTVSRHLAEPVAQVKRGREAIAAMVLAAPEQAWIAQGVPPDLTEVALTTLCALNLMPLGFEG
jgi:hypothetical protein